MPPLIPLERRTRGRARSTPTLEAMRRDNPEGTPLRLIDLVRLTGLSKPTLLADVREGLLIAKPWRPGKRMLKIEFRDAQAYLRLVGTI